jgi:hypothetical protein
MMCHNHNGLIAWHYWHPADTNLYFALCPRCMEGKMDEGFQDELFEMPYGAQKERQ